MNVTITPRLNARHAGIVYATVTCVEPDADLEGELLIGATLDYCLSACADRGYTIVNGHEVLMWLHKNTNFVGYTVV